MIVIKYEKIEKRSRERGPRKKNRQWLKSQQGRKTASSTRECRNAVMGGRRTGVLWTPSWDQPTTPSEKKRGMEMGWGDAGETVERREGQSLAHYTEFASDNSLHPWDVANHRTGTGSQLEMRCWKRDLFSIHPSCLYIHEPTVHFSDHLQTRATSGTAPSNLHTSSINAEMNQQSWWYDNDSNFTLTIHVLLWRWESPSHYESQCREKH